MQTAWTKHLKGENKDRFQNTLLGSKEVLNRLAEIITEMENETDRGQKTTSAYDNPNWAYQQAHKNGYASALFTIKNLITLDHQKDTF